MGFAEITDKNLTENFWGSLLHRIFKTYQCWVIPYKSYTSKDHEG
jgi:hypothetical protein